MKCHSVAILPKFGPGGCHKIRRRNPPWPILDNIEIYVVLTLHVEGVSDLYVREDTKSPTCGYIQSLLFSQIITFVYVQVLCPVLCPALTPPFRCVDSKLCISLSYHLLIRNCVVEFTG